jgi:hypothetical protein
MITSHQEPNKYTPAYNENLFVVSSDNTSQDNFKYVLDVYRNGVFAKQLSRSPHYDTGSGYFDIQRIIETFVTFDFALTSFYGVFSCGNSIEKITAKFGEQYGPSSGVTTYPNLLNSSDYYVFPAAIPTREFPAFDYSVYTADTPGRFLTSKFDDDNEFTIYEDQKDFLNIIQDSSGDVNYVRVQTFTSSNVLIQTVKIQNTFNTLTDKSHRFLRILSGYNMNNIDSGELISGAQPILHSTVAYYRMATYDAADNQTSELYRFNIDRECTPYTQYDIFFLNKYGAFDSMRFDRVTTKKKTGERVTYKKTTGTIDATSWGLNVSDVAVAEYYNKQNDDWTLRTNWLTDQQQIWLEELIFSPNVYVVLNGEIVPITVKNTEWKEKTHRTDSLFQLTLETSFSVQNYRQRN